MNCLEARNSEKYLKSNYCQNVLKAFGLLLIALIYTLKYLHVPMNSFTSVVRHPFGSNLYIGLLTVQSKNCLFFSKTSSISSRYTCSTLIKRSMIIKSRSLK